MNRIRVCVALAAAFAAMLVPMTAFAAAPQLAPAAIVTEGFETTSASGMVVTPLSTLGVPAPAWWGRAGVAQARHSGSWGLWCAGSRSFTTLYPVGTAGDATWDLPQMSDYYSSNLSLWYVQPSLGTADEAAFTVRWTTYDGSYSYVAYSGEGTFPLTSTWLQRSWNLSSPNSSRNLSRNSSIVQLRFVNQAPGGLGGSATGQGPSVDDLSITGWKYGPVRNLVAVPDGSTTHLAWVTPWRSTAATSTEERPIAYRVYREIDGSNNWTELTSDKITSTTFDETGTLALDATYRYAVQVVDQGPGAGYGQVILASDSITHTYVAPRYTLSYTPAAHGSLVGSATQVVIWNGSGSAVTAVPATGYHFTGWSDGVQTATRTDVNVVADKAVTANFAVDTFTLQYNAAVNGSIVGSSTQVVAAGGSGSSVTAVADDGYRFVSWSDGVLTAARTDSNVIANKSVTASFQITTYTVTATQAAHGSISPAGVQTVNWHGSISFSIAAASGYHVADVLVDGGSVGAVSSYPFTNVEAPHTITAVFAANPLNTYTLSYAAGQGGSVVGSSTQVVTSGSSGTAVTATPGTGYHFTGWSDGVLTATRTDSPVTADKSVTAHFGLDTFTLSYSANAHGSIVGSATQIVGYGFSGSSVTAAPDNGYHFVSWSDGVSTATRTDSDVKSGKTVSASFAVDANPPVFTITVPATPVKIAQPFYTTSETDVTGLSATLDGKLFIIGTVPGTSVSTAGTHSLEVTMTTAGGVTHHSAQFHIDLTPPVTAISGLPTGIGTALISIHLTATDGPVGGASGVAAIYYNLDGAGFVGYSTDVPVTWGKHTVSYYSVDAAGNFEATKTVPFDLRQPTALTITKPGTWTHGHTYTLYGYLSPGTSGLKVLLQYRRPGSTHWYSSTRTTTSSSGRGKWTYSYKPPYKGTYYFKVSFAGTTTLNKSASTTLTWKAK